MQMRHQRWGRRRVTEDRIEGVPEIETRAPLWNVLGERKPCLASSHTTAPKRGMTTEERRRSTQERPTPEVRHPTRRWVATTGGHIEDKDMTRRSKYAREGIGATTRRVGKSGQANADMGKQGTTG